MTGTVAVAAGLLGLGGTAGTAQTPSPSPGSPAPPAPDLDGRFLYQRDCAWCHGERGQGTRNGPNLQGVGAASADFELSTGRMPIPNVQEQPLRADPVYTPEQIRALTEVVAGFGPGPEIPEVDLASADLGEGAELYEIHCAACHSSTGIGGALTSGLLAPDVLHSTPVQIAEAIRIGGAGLRSGNMPRFGPETFTDEQLNAVVAYTVYLQNPENPGGAALGRVGPVMEGLVAWVAGMLPLLVFVIWLGKRTASKRASTE